MGVMSIGSRVGGIPELLSDEAMFAPGSAEQMATLVGMLVADPARMSRLAASQWREAQLIATSYSGDTHLGDFLRTLPNKTRGVEG
jgi:hypothetical protein